MIHGHIRKNTHTEPVAQEAIRLLGHEARASRVSQQELGQAIHLAGPTVSQRLSGHSRMTLDEYVGLCKRLGINPSDLLSQAMRNTARRD